MEFQKSLQEKLGEHDPTDVDELILDDLYEGLTEFTPDHKKTLELYKNLLHLSLNGFGLKSLKNFPKIPELRILEVRSNNFSGEDFKELHSLFPALYKLKVGENPIKSVDMFKPLADLPTFKKLELQDTEIAQKNNYREEIFKILKNVEVVDHLSKTGEEVDSTLYDDEFGEFDEDFEDDEGFEDEDEEFDDEEDFEDEEESEEAPQNKSGKKQRKE